MNQELPSIEEWEKLYEIASRYKELSPWDLMWDSDVFGVQNPESGEIGYCCVLGRAGMEYGFLVYLGIEGLKAYLKTQSMKFHPDDMDSLDSLHIQKCLNLSFEDRNHLTKKDIKLIKTIGLKFKGSRSYPFFRSFEPGYFPWYLTREEVKYLTIALQQTIGVCNRFKENPQMMKPPSPNKYFVRTVKKEGDSLIWNDEWIEPSIKGTVEIVDSHIDKEYIEEIKKKVSMHSQTWESDVFYSPFQIAEKNKRPYFPYMFLWVDNESGFILNHYIVEPTKQYSSEFIKQFLNLIQDIKIMPERILVRKPDIFVLLQPFASAFGIKLEITKELEMVKEARLHMTEFFKKKQR